jgi:16S rRNA (adenine1518-N6/adenine1519-N6)-dimethyltransferase
MSLIPPPRKRFSQNFLRDETVIRRILAGIAPTGADHLVEIGPGRGALTAGLLANCARLDAVELDRDLAGHLREKFSSQVRFHLHSADALSFDFTALYQGEALRVVGNLPYNISTPLLFHLFTQAHCIRDMHFMLQKEVVERMCARAGDRHNGRLSIMTQFHCVCEELLEVPPESFFPVPAVQSAVVRMIPHPTKTVTADEDRLRRVVTAAFGQRRKTLRNSLGQLLGEQDIRSLGLDPNARAENLGLQEFAALSQLLEKATP